MPDTGFFFFAGEDVPKAGLAPKPLAASAGGADRDFLAWEDVVVRTAEPERLTAAPEAGSTKNVATPFLRPPDVSTLRTAAEGPAAAAITAAAMAATAASARARCSAWLTASAKHVTTTQENSLKGLRLDLGTAGRMHK